MDAVTIPSIERQVTVNASQEKAFRTFTEGIHTWWPETHHIGESPLERAVLEPKAGGRWYEIGVDGSECDWGTVLVWEPPHRVVLSWQVDGDWGYDPDPSRASRVEVRFTPDGPGRTIVQLEHRNLERMGSADSLTQTLGGQGGWNRTLAAFRTAAEAV
jgi:uncharacterized protein YndB with AHSA1/START domain